MPVASMDRITRVNELLKREIADLIERLCLNDGGYLVSVTKVRTSSNLKDALVFLSVLGGKGPEQEEKAKSAVATLSRNRAEIQRRIAKDIVLKYTPVLHFEIDKNIEDGDRVLALIQEMENGKSN